jgi:hypothetical protein
MLTDEQILEIAEKHHASHPGVDEWWEFRDREDVVAFGRAILASAGQAEPQKPIATLHDDGYWTWKPGMRMHECNQAGWWMDVYAAPTPAAARTYTTTGTGCDRCGRALSEHREGRYCPAEKPTAALREAKP